MSSQSTSVGAAALVGAGKLAAPRPADAAVPFLWRTLPHEWAFGAMLLLLMVRFGWQPGPARIYALPFLGYFLLNLGLSWWCGRHPTPLRWQVRLSYYFTAMGMVFYTLPAAIRAMQDSRADTLLQAIDARMLSRPAADYFLGWQSPLLTDVMVTAYLFFFYYLLFGPGYYCFSDLRRFRACIVGMFCIYAVGLFSYALLPAGGPHLAWSFATPLPAGPVGRLMLPVIDGGSNGIDVFPSIHASITAYLLAFDALYHRRRFWLLLLPVVLLWTSTVYLRYHYLVDLLAGWVLAACGIGIALLYQRSRLEQAVQRDAQRVLQTS